MTLHYAADDISISPFEEKLLRLFPRKKFFARRMRRWSRRKYKDRDNLYRAWVKRWFGMPVGKYTYGYEQLCFKGSTIAEIGAFTSIAADVNVSLGNHPVDKVSTHPFYYLKSFGLTEHDKTDIAPKNGKITIGHDVWIGRGASIMTNVTIGHGAIIAAGAVVTKDVPPYALVGGIPARIIRYRFDEATIEKLLKSEWWTWDDQKIRENIPLFFEPDQFASAIS